MTRGDKMIDDELTLFIDNNQLKSNFIFLIFKNLQHASFKLFIKFI